jgi:hypothetical protein
VIEHAPGPWVLDETAEVTAGLADLIAAIAKTERSQIP